MALRLIDDDRFRARRMGSKYFSYLRHSFLEDIYTSLNGNESLYAIFFWCNEKSAIDDTGNVAEIFTLRFLAENNFTQYYQALEDPHHDSGEAIVYWSIEGSKKEFSEIYVDLKSVDVFCENRWKPYEYFKESYL